ncbi:MAG: ImmA/IrrE family metallo-endopeptidase [Streptococcaceae bacterium]|nr:ImmA/IrrE family metallo-endopeptidase [Streptococcaceae bacterium]MCH4177268.1 ImmA/IrrE family metallo-endopeptidase [Streptococcaceae bacterium]
MTIKEIAKQHGVILMFCDMEAEGGYIFVREEKFIFLNNNLEEKDLLRVFYHEMSHVLNHTEMQSVYNKTYTAHSRIEADANRDMIKKEIRDVIDYCDNDESSILNWKRVAEIIDLPLTSTNEWLIKEELSEYYLG